MFNIIKKTPNPPNPTKKPDEIMDFNIDEAVLAFCIVGGLDPQTFKHNRAKSLIYKCKSLIELSESTGVNTKVRVTK